MHWPRALTGVRASGLVAPSLRLALASVPLVRPNAGRRALAALVAPSLRLALASVPLVRPNAGRRPLAALVAPSLRLALASVPLVRPDAGRGSRGWRLLRRPCGWHWRPSRWSVLSLDPALPSVADAPSLRLALASVPIVRPVARSGVAVCRYIKPIRPHRMPV